MFNYRYKKLDSILDWAENYYKVPYVDFTFCFSQHYIRFTVPCENPFTVDFNVMEFDKMSLFDIHKKFKEKDNKYDNWLNPRY